MQRGKFGPQTPVSARGKSRAIVMRNLATAEDTKQSYMANSASIQHAYSAGSCTGKIYLQGRYRMTRLTLSTVRPILSCFFSIFDTVLINVCIAAHIACLVPSLLLPLVDLRLPSRCDTMALDLSISRPRSEAPPNMLEDLPAARFARSLRTAAVLVLAATTGSPSMVTAPCRLMSKTCVPPCAAPPIAVCCCCNWDGCICCCCCGNTASCWGVGEASSA
jgi:hypothetical protein